MIDWNDCLPTKEMQADFERFKELKTTEEKEAFKKEMQDKYNKLPEAQKEAYKKASEAGLKATVNACNDYIERVEEAILRDKLGELPEAISFSYIAKKYFGKSRNWLYQRINGNIVSPLSLIIRCSLNPKNRPIEHLPLSASPSKVL